MITVTDSAKAKAMELMAEANKSGQFIRVGVEGGVVQGLCTGLILTTYSRKVIRNSKTTD